ncbi:hypothetical protein Tco_0593793, partial [Tanacetum coccineum]
PYVQATQETEGTHVIITAPINPEGQQQSSAVSSVFVSNMLNPRPDTGIDLIFTLNIKATSLVDVLVTTIVEPTLLSTATLPPPPTPLITHMQQTLVPIPSTVLSSSLQDLPNFGSLFGFDHRLITLETDFSEFKKMNQFAEAVYSIPGIVDAYLANKMQEAVKTDQVKEQVKAQVTKILPKIKKTVNDQLEAEVMSRSSTESKTSLAIAANLSELELKKIFIDKMESNKSIYRSDEQKNLYKALVEAYKSDKLILDTYGDTVSFKRRIYDEDKYKEPSAGSTRGSKSLHKSADESAHAEEPMYTAKDLEEPAHQEFETGVTEDQPADETPQPSDWFQKPTRLPSPDQGPHESFDELIDTPLDFSAFMMNRLKVDTLTPKLLDDPTFELMKGTCKSLVKLEYFFEEVYKETTNQLDWNNPKGQQYPHDLRKPLPLIPNSYNYGHIKWIEDLVPNTMWSEVSVNYHKHALWGISHWGRKRQQFYRFVANRKSSRDVYYKRRRLQEASPSRHLRYADPSCSKQADKSQCVESYQKKLDITKPDTYKSDLKCRDAYTSYSNPKGFIYQNKDKKNKLMRIDELYKFSDGTLDDVQTALNDRLKGLGWNIYHCIYGDR